MNDRIPFIRRPLIRVLLLVGLCALFFLPGLGNTTMKREQELRVALTARDMAEGGSWLIPHFLGEIRLRKPPLMYWIVATGYKLADSASATVARIPSVIAATFMALSIYLCGARLIGRSRAFLAALMALSCIILLRHARSAETDVTFSLFTMLASMCGYMAMDTSKPLRWWSVAGLCAGLGFMIKGPAAVVLPALAWLAYALPQREIRRRFFSKYLLVGILLCLLIALPWYIMIFNYSPQADAADNQIEKELVDTYQDSHHKGPFYYYLYALPKAMMPWGFLLPWAVWVFAKARHHRGVRFVLGWFVTSFIVLSSISSKQEHYTMLIVPPSALILGWFFHYMFTTQKSWQRSCTRIFTSVVVILIGGAMIVAPALHDTVGLSTGLGVVFVITGLLLFGIVILRKPSLNIAASVAALSLLIVHYVHTMHAIKDGESILPRLAALGSNQWAQAPVVYGVGPDVAIFEFYLGRHLQNRSTLEEAWNHAHPGDILVTSWNRKKQITWQAGPRTLPFVELEHKELNCAAYLKTPEDTP